MPRTSPTHGSSHPSGSEAKRPANLKKRTDWKGLSSRLQRELDEITLDHEDLKARHTTLSDEYSELRAKGLGPREVSKLHRLEHLFSRIVNARVSKDSRKILDKLIDDLRYVGL